MTDDWKKFYEAKDEFIEALDIAQANLLLEEAGSKVRLKKQNLNEVEKLI